MIKSRSSEQPVKLNEKCTQGHCVDQRRREHIYNDPDIQEAQAKATEVQPYCLSLDMAQMAVFACQSPEPISSASIQPAD
ncbi:hypothetical protein OH492_08685 [Vibrio chagasii]|nr:hypothetical protein [Vibrio chagasii]